MEFCWLRRTFFLILFSLLATSGAIASNPDSTRFTRLTDYVNPFIGTGGHGHTYPGASYPFGMVQVSPDTRLVGWDGCSAYHASDDTIFGFSHTHLSGTGCSDYGDILLMPVTGEVPLQAYAYASPFDLASEHASAGYYRVKLSRYDIGVELTATKRSGFHRYLFPAGSKPSVILNLQHRDKVISSGLKVNGSNEVEGYRFSSAWAPDQRLYFVIRFSSPFRTLVMESEGQRLETTDLVAGTDIKALFSFPESDGSNELLVKVGISAVSAEGARRNLETESIGWEFDQVLEACRVAWTNELGKITVNGGTRDDRTVFYTALYHTMLSPNLYTDVDGNYLGRDLQVHQADGFDYYTVFSLWDTYRALHPLLTLIDRKRTNDFINTFIRQYREGGLLPVWELSANETNCMIGYHAVPVIADAFLKGIRNYDTLCALEAMKHSANQDHMGLRFYKTTGFIPGDEEGESVSKTLEYAYDDWCIAQMARAMGREEDYRNFIRRAQYYKNIYDPSTGFMRAKLNNLWFTPFDPYEVNFNYTEANAWQYTFCVPQDIHGLVALMGSRESFSDRLDALFTARTETTGRDQADITGLVGQYAHGNEPSHHMAYLYDYLGQPWKTQELVHRIMTRFYDNSRDGLCGNEDCGQMSAWYVFSALGFYPVTPGSGLYAIGTPHFPFAHIELENGNTFTIRANNLSDENFYIQSCTLNGRSHDSPSISHEDIMNGGEMVFGIGPVPQYEWGGVGRLAVGSWQTSISEFLIQPVPFVSEGKDTFFDSTTITLSSADSSAPIFYSVQTVSDIRDPASRILHLYTGPIPIKETTTIHAYAQRDGGEPSGTIESTFTKIPKNRKIRLNTSYAPQYSAGGDAALIDFRRGGVNFRTGLWQGYEGVDLDAVVDLGEVREIRRIAAGFLQDVGSWIFFPMDVAFYTSMDGHSFSTAGITIHEVSQQDFTPRRLELWSTQDPPVSARYVRVVAKSQGTCPAWHPGAGNKCWIFTDEISVNE